MGREDGRNFLNYEELEPLIQPEKGFIGFVDLDPQQLVIELSHDEDPPVIIASLRTPFLKEPGDVTPYTRLTEIPISRVFEELVVFADEFNGKNYETMNEHNQDDVKIIQEVIESLTNGERTITYIPKPY